MWMWTTASTVTGGLDNANRETNRETNHDANRDANIDGTSPRDGVRALPGWRGWRHGRPGGPSGALARWSELNRKGDGMGSDRRFEELTIVTRTDKPTLQPSWFA
jgi:hypothetical protein